MKIIIECEKEKNQRVILEPWGDEYDLIRNTSLTLIGKNVPGDGYFSIVYTEYEIKVYAEWDKCVVEVYDASGENVSITSESPF